MTPLSAPALWSFILTGHPRVKVKARAQAFFEARQIACVKLGAHFGEVVDPGQVECVKRPGVGK